MATKKTDGAAKPTVRRRIRKETAVTQEQIAERAYYLHLERGGDALENWLSAEQELLPV